MNFKTYLYASLALAMACAATACDENAWNNHLDGFEENNIANPTIEDVRTIEYTLTDAEYATIAGLADNKTLAGEDGKAALAAVGTKKCFSADAPASKYVPAFLQSTNFPYFTLTDGSAVKLTYRTLENAPAVYTEAQTVQTYKVTAEQYKEDVWGTDDYVEAFAPSEPASEYIPSLLADYVSAEKAKYCIVTYNQALQEPVYGGGASDLPVEPVAVFAETFTESLGEFTIENVLLPAELDFIWSWGGSNYGAKASAYKGGSFASESWLISPVVDLAGYAEPKMEFEHVVNKFPDAEFARANCTLWAREQGGAWTQVTIPEYTDNTSWTFGNSGVIDLAAYTGKKMQFAFKYVSELDKSGTWEIKNLTLTALPAGRAAVRGAIFIPTEVRNVVYSYANGQWAPAKNFVVLDPADYTAMGQTYGNLTTAEPYLSTYLNRNFPYAADDDVKYIYWLHYAGGSTAYECSAYIFKNGSWTADDFVVEESNQFVKNGGKWIYDPNVTINLPAGKGQPMSTLYFQACVDWVYENICKPLGDTDIKSGKFYISSYGNNEYYSGTSAYQGNIDLRASAAKAQYPAEYESMTDEAVVALEKKRFMEEVMPGALGKLHPDAKPLDGLDVFYTINFAVYTGTTNEYTAVFKVVGPGKFEPVSCTWDNAE